jgi:NAD(P)-dependent dehydrogenase (short-subunit alcohol dehydrogenase family)
MNHPVFEKNHVAVITGGASGIGLAVAQKLASFGMRVCIADINEVDLESAASDIDGDVLTVKTDVSNLADIERLRDQVLAHWGEVNLLMNNAGITGQGAGPWTGLDKWQKIINTNLWGIVNSVQTFLPVMINGGGPGAVICTGSKQGITNPPGSTAYNVAKAGVRTLTEGIAHELRNTENCEITAHLLVPGFTYTGMMRKHMPQKPEAAWDSAQVAEMLVERMSKGDFYIICPDNDVTSDMDKKRLQWNTDDLIQNRPALSRWHPDFAEEFSDFMKAE